MMLNKNKSKQVTIEVMMGLLAFLDIFVICLMKNIRAETLPATGLKQKTAGTIVGLH